jgi:hypothetical protein
VKQNFVSAGSQQTWRKIRKTKLATTTNQTNTTGKGTGTKNNQKLRSEKQSSPQSDNQSRNGVRDEDRKVALVTAGEKMGLRTSTGMERWCGAKKTRRTTIVEATSKKPSLD